MDAKLARRLELASGHGRFTRTCGQIGDGPYREYKRIGEGEWVDLGPCSHDHPKWEYQCCCGEKDCGRR